MADTVAATTGADPDPGARPRPGRELLIALAAEDALAFFVAAVGLAILIGMIQSCDTKRVFWHRRFFRCIRRGYQTIQSLPTPHKMNEAHTLRAIKSNLSKSMASHLDTEPGPHTVEALPTDPIDPKTENSLINTDDQTPIQNHSSNHQPHPCGSKGTLVTAPPPLRIIPPLNFCPVERQLYRLGQPSMINQMFLRSLGLKTILWLASEEPQDDFLEFCLDNHIEIEFIGIASEFANGVATDYRGSGGMPPLNPWDSLNEATIKKALDTIANRSVYPLLVCCGMGRHRTGTVIGCLRRLQGWNLASVSEEYRRFTGARGGRILVELLIESFDIDLIDIDPVSAPLWLT